MEAFFVAILQIISVSVGLALCILAVAKVIYFFEQIKLQFSQEVIRLDVSFRIPIWVRPQKIRQSVSPSPGQFYPAPAVVVATRPVVVSPLSPLPTLEQAVIHPALPEADKPLPLHVYGLAHPGRVVPANSRRAAYWLHSGSNPDKMSLTHGILLADYFTEADQACGGLTELDSQLGQLLAGDEFAALFFAGSNEIPQG